MGKKTIDRKRERQRSKGRKTKRRERERRREGARGESPVEGDSKCQVEKKKKKIE